jgi:hypothetical protein
VSSDPRLRPAKSRKRALRERRRSRTDCGRRSPARTRGSRGTGHRPRDCSDGSMATRFERRGVKPQSVEGPTSCSRADGLNVAHPGKRNTRWVRRVPVGFRRRSAIEMSEEIRIRRSCTEATDRLSRLTRLPGGKHTDSPLRRQESTQFASLAVECHATSRFAPSLAREWSTGVPRVPQE